MRCPVCGSENPNGASVCAMCGSPLSGGNSSGNAGGGQPPMPPARSPKPPKKKGSKKPLVISLIVAGLACVLVGLGLFFFLNNPSNQEEDPDVILKDNVVIYNAEKPAFDILSYDNYTLRISRLDNIDEGTVLAFPVTDKTPNGLLVKVTSISQVDEGYELSTEQAALTDAIEKCDIDKETAFLEDEETQDIEEADEVTLGFTKAEASEEGVKAFSYDDGVLKDEAWLSLVTGLKVEWGDVDMKLGIKVHEKTSLSLEKQKDVIDKTNDLFEFKKPLTIWVGPLPVVLSNELDVSMPVKMKASASLTQSAETDKVYGFHYTTKEGMKPLESGESESGGPAFSDPSGTISVSLTFGPKLTFSCELYGVAGPEIEAALENKLEANMTVSTGSEQVENPITIPGTSLNAWGSIEGAVTVPISGKFVLEIPSFNIFDKSDKPTEMDLFDTKDAITLWSYSLKTEGPVIYNDTTSGQQAGVPIEGILHVETFESLCKSNLGESNIKLLENANDYFAYIEVSKSVSVPVWTYEVGPRQSEAEAVWSKQNITLKAKDCVVLFNSTKTQSAKNLLQYNGKKIIVTPNLVASGKWSGTELSIEHVHGTWSSVTTGANGILEIASPASEVDWRFPYTFQEGTFTQFPGTTFKIELVG